MKPVKQRAGKVVGIDVSKDRLDGAVVPGRRRFQAGQTAEDVAALADRIARLRPALVVLEATGGLEEPVLYALVERKVPVHRCEPKRPRFFARSLGLLAKTDAIDALVLARFGATGELEPQEFPDAAVRHLDALVTRRRQLVDTITAEGNRLQATSDVAARQDIEAHLAWLRGRVKALEREIEICIGRSPELKAKVDRLRTAPGIGKNGSAVLVCTLPELGRMDRWEVAMITGTAPLNRDSGNSQGRKFTWGGRAVARTALSMAVLTAIKHNPAIQAVYVRLVARGKPKKVAMMACMRKLVIMLNAMIRDETTWRQTAPAAN